jgi:hypothetical protein
VAAEAAERGEALRRAGDVVYKGDEETRRFLPAKGTGG